MSPSRRPSTGYGDDALLSSEQEVSGPSGNDVGIDPALAIGEGEGEEDDGADDGHLEQDAQRLDARRRPWVLPTHQRHFVILGAAAVKGQHEEGAENPEQDIDGERRGDRTSGVAGKRGEVR